MARHRHYKDHDAPYSEADMERDGIGEWMEGSN